MEISKNFWSSGTRPCAFSLNLQGGSVFVDFDVEPNGLVHLVRISFDGYGCCNTAGNVTRLSAVESQILIQFDDTYQASCEQVSEILLRYFNHNRDTIWQDALRVYSLIDGESQSPKSE
ncbi:hypothetical protein SH668x_002222 [Planctomicrobium sp. SH668]|uniref:hypothetical protein n=1 Tax=Planctomicrobium sp. SH668 TaxID=3448126 RepID=UPI003F5BE7EB